MDQIVTNNRTKIEDACTSSFQYLKRYCEHIKTHKQQVEAISQQPYIQEEKLRQINELEEKTKAQVVPLQEKIIDQIDAINDAATEIAEVPMNSVDLSNIGTLSALLSGAASDDAIADISAALQDYVDTYKGQPKALRVIRVALERTGNSDTRAFKARNGGSLIFTVESRIGKLQHMADRLSQIHLNYAFDLAAELEAFAVDMGVKLPKTFKQMMNAVNPDDYEDAYFARLADLMGLTGKV